MLRWITILLALIVVGGAGIATMRSWNDRETTGGNLANSIDTQKLTSLEPAELSNNWPQLHGPTGNGWSAETALLRQWPPQGLITCWEQEIGRGYSSPVVQNGRLILHHRIEDEEWIEALDAQTGEQLWRDMVPTSYVCRYDYSDGPYATPACAADCVVTITAEAQMRCLQLDDGQLKWSRDLRAEYELEEGLFGFGASPMIRNDRIYLNLGAKHRDAGVVAFSLKDGSTIWEATDHGISYSTPRMVVTPQLELLVSLTGYGAVGIIAETGKVLWELEFAPKSPDSVNAVTPLVIGQIVLFVTGPGPGALCAQIEDDGHYRELWRDRKVIDSQFNNLVYHDHHVYGFSSSRRGGARLRCVDIRSGELKWDHASVLARGMLLAADDMLYALGERGHLGAFQITPDAATPLWLTESPILNSPCYSAPALSAGKLFLRNETRIVCFVFSNEISGQ